MQTRYDEVNDQKRTQVETFMSMIKRRQGAFCKGTTRLILNLRLGIVPAILGVCHTVAKLAVALPMNCLVCFATVSVSSQNHIPPGVPLFLPRP